MSNTIIIAEISEKNGWFNIKTNDNKDVSVMQAKCPKLTEQLKNAKAGSEVTGKLVEKDGKAYLWDIEAGKSSGEGNKSFAPKDKKWESAIAAAQATGHMLALTSKDVTTEQFDKFFNHIHSKIMSCVTAPTSEPNK